MPDRAIGSVDQFINQRFLSDFSNHEEFIKKHKETLGKMFALVGGHTLMIVLLSRLPENALLDEEKIYALLVTRSQLPSDKIFIRKDGAYIENTIIEIAKKIFDISQLSYIERSIMKYMTIIPFTGIKPDLFEKLTDYSRKDIKNLIQSGWIICDAKSLSIRLHPVICDTMLSQDETKPSKEMCDKICERIMTLQKFCPPQSNEWNTLNKIPACIASRIIFPLISNTQIFNRLKPEYRDSVLTLHKILQNYADSEY